MTDGKFSLRPATVDDLDRILEIENQVHTSPWNRDHFSKELSKPYSGFLVFTDDETDTEVAGYVVCWMMFDECQILNLAVALPYRGLGMGMTMIRKVISLANTKGIQKITLEVRKSNQPAIQLYQNAGFVITHVRKEFYSNGEDAYQMQLTLVPETFLF